TVTASSADNDSTLTYTFPTLPAGWTASGTGNTRSYTYTASPTAPSRPHNVTPTNGAGLTASTAITLTPDTTGPTGQTVSLSGGPWYTTTSIPLVLANGSDTGAGVDPTSGLVERASATLTGGVCGTFGSYSPVTLTGGADTTVQSGNCYRYRYTTSDLIGNQSGPSTPTADAMVDTTSPGAPSLTYTALSATSASGDTLCYSGAAGPTAPSGPQDVTATNGAGLTASTAITLTPDTTPPTGQTVSLSGGPWYTTTNIPLTLDNGTDNQAGIDPTSGLVERATATLTNGTCDSFGAYTPITLTAGADTTVQTGHCYRYRYTTSDLVGNQSTPSADAIVDTSGSAVAIAGVSGTGDLSYDATAGTLWFRPSGSGSFTLAA